MKTIKYISMRVLAVAALALVFAMPAKAQLTDNGYANIDWQFNFPLSNHFADKASGWGMSFEGGYYVTPNFALGAFLAYHSNHEYFGRQTLPVGEGGSINTDQQHTLFQLPFGLAGRYTFDRGSAFQPYVGVKVGPQYAEMKSTFNVYEANKSTWVSMYHRKLVSTFTHGLMVRVCTLPLTIAMAQTRATCSLIV